MRLELRRTKSTIHATLGDLYVDGEFLCHTLEDVVRELGPNGEGKVWGSTAIPAGTYPVTVNASQRFGRLMPRLLQVPHFDGILIHKGNTSQDTHGCILVGTTIAGPDLITHSTEAWALLFPLIEVAHGLGEAIEIAITNEFPGAPAAG